MWDYTSNTGHLPLSQVLQNQASPLLTGNLISYTPHKINTNMCLNMRLHSASNGMVLEITSTDYMQANPNTSTLHVLSHANLGEELQKIILVELLKK